MNKTDIEKEVKYLHEQYEKDGGKFIKPSFKYIFEFQDFSRHDGDYYVSNILDDICIKAVELIELGEFGTIYEIIENSNGYVCEEIYKIDKYRKEITPSKRWQHELPMHVAWRTRGDCLNENTSKV